MYGTPPSLERRELAIGLLWHSVNSGNLGVGALTVSHIAIFEKLAKQLGIAVRFTILGWADRGPAYFGGANVAGLPLTSRQFLPGESGLHGAARRCDLVCDISAGDSFADIYGLKRFGFQALSKLIVLRAGTPLILSPQTIGPFQRPSTRRVANSIMRQCRIVVARDELSLTRIPDRAEVRSMLATDVAFRLPYDRKDHGDGCQHVGINVSGLLFNGGYDGRNMFGLKCDYRKLVHALLRNFVNRKNCRVHLISHVFSEDSEVEDDYRVSVRLANAFPKVVVAPRFTGPSEAKSYLAGMDFVLGSRMHACIAALSAGVPVLPLAYSPKFEGLFRSLGYRSCADCTTESIEAILEKANCAFDSLETLRLDAEAARRNAELRLYAYENVLRETMVESALNPA